MPINDEKDLGKALGNDEDTIEIEGDLARKVFKIKATGKVAWVVAFGAIGVTLTALLLTPTPEPFSKGLLPIAGGAAISILGVGATTTAISIAIAGGGIGALKKLRSYKIIEYTGAKILLRKS